MFKLSTDHHTVVSWIRCWERKLERSSSPIGRVYLKCLPEDPAKMVFNSHIQRSFNHIPEVLGSMESE